MLPIAPVTTSGNVAAKPPSNAIHFSPILAEWRDWIKGEVFRRMKTSPEGLSEADAEKRLAEAGPNGERKISGDMQKKTISLAPPTDLSKIESKREHPL
jgi:Cation transporter/ATPase, N-terminus